MALLITKFAGAQAPYLCEVDTTSTGFTTSGSVARGNQLYSYLMDSSADAIDFQISANSGYVIYVGFAIYFAGSVPTGSNNTIGYYDVAAGGGQLACELNLNSSGQLEFLEGDDGASTVLATSSALSADTWYYVEIAFKNRATAGDWYFYIDDVEIGSGTANGNFDSLGATDRWRFFQGATYNRYLTDIYCGYDNAASVNEAQRLGGATKVVYYWSTAATATSSSGVDLDIGTWSACCSDTLSPTVAAEVTGTGQARRLLDEGTDGTYTGPYDQFGTLDDCHGYKVTCMAERGGGGGSTHFIDLGGTSGYSLSAVVSLNTSATYVQAYFNSGDPGIGTGAIGVGFGTNGGQDFECYNIQAAVLHGERGTSPRAVVQNPANPGDLSRMTFTENQATVTLANHREVTCSTEVIAFTESAATVPIDRSINSLSKSELLAFTESKATIARKKTITGKTAKPKQWKALEWSEYWLDGHTGIYGSHDAASINNLIDKDTATKYDLNSYAFPQVQGIENAGPVSSPTAVPVGIKVRWYLSGTNGASTAGYAGWRPLERSEYTGNYADGYEYHSIEVTGGASGSWTPWVDLNIAYNHQGASTTTPYTWANIQNHFTVTTSGIELGGNIYCHGVQVAIEEAEPANLISGYVDGSHGWNTDEGQWQDVANAYDGSEATFASTVWGSAGTYVGQYFSVAGNTLAQGAAEEEVRSVWFRAKLRGQYTASNNLLSCIIYPYHPEYYDYAPDQVKFPIYSGKSLLPYSGQYFAAPDDPELFAYWDFAATNTAFWTPWYKIDFDSLDADWQGSRRWKSWEEIQKMGFRLYRGPDPDRVSTLEIAKVEYIALAEPPTSQRGGSKIKQDRGVNCGTEAVTMAGTLSTVSFASPRNVTCTTEAISMASTGAIDRVRGVNCTTEALSMTSTGAVTRVRGVIGTTEVLTFTEAASALNLARGVSSTTEALALTEQGATINASRVTSGVTELLSLTEAQAAANLSRNTVSTTEALSMASTGAVNRGRNKASTTEALTLTESQAGISTSQNLDVTCTTEVLTFTETPASVNGTRIAAAPVEITAFVENASTVNAERFVAATTETLALTDNDSTVAFDRNVGATTEVVSLTEGTSVVDRQRGVNAGTEAVLFVENPATANLARGAQCATEVLTLADNDSSLARSRGVSAGTEALALTESASTVDRQRGVNAGTEAVVMTESVAQVTRGANLDVNCSTEVLSLAENTAAVVRDRAVTGTTEVVSFVELPADIARNRSFVTTSESVLLTEAAATLGLDRGVSALTEALGLTESASTVARDRVFTGSTEVLNVSENTATIDTATSNNPRNVTCTTEAVSFAESAANVNGKRIATASVELTALAESAANINRTLSLAATTEVLLAAEAAALVNLSRAVNSTSEQLSLTEAAANVSTTTSRIINALTESLAVSSSAASNQTRGVSSSTETLSISENLSSIQVLRNVVATTEQLVLAEVGASVLTSRDVVGLTSPLVMAESAGQVFRGANLDVTGLTAAMALLESAATVAFPRRVVAISESLLLTESSALANLPKLIAAAISPVTIATTQATIGKLPASVQPGSMVWVDPGVEGAIFVDNLVIQRYD